MSRPVRSRPSPGAAGAAPSPPLPSARGVCGQSTVEYLVVLAAFVAMLAALALLWRWSAAGGLGELAVQAASHSTAQGALALLKDVLVY